MKDSGKPYSTLFHHSSAWNRTECAILAGVFVQFEAGANIRDRRAGAWATDPALTAGPL